VGDRAPASGELLLAYRLDEGIPLDVADSYRHVERWMVSVSLRRSPGDDAVEIGYAHVLVFNLEPGMDIGDLAERVSGTWIDVATRADAPRVPGDALDAAEPTGHVMLLDRVWLDPSHRGTGLGPIVAAAVIERLARGCRLAACYPAPFEVTSAGAEDRARSVEALGRVWSKVGFRHWRDGVWMLDLDTSDVHATLAELVAARSRLDSRP
jgi:GNAT superfamily N-acetyltransferase